MTPILCDIIYLTFAHLYPPNKVLACDGNNQLIELDLVERIKSKELIGLNTIVTHIEPNLANKEYILARTDGKIVFLNEQFIAPPTKSIQLPAQLTTLAIHPQKSEMLTGLESGGTLLWDIDPKLKAPIRSMIIQHKDKKSPIRKSSYSLDGHYIASLSEDGELLVVENPKDKLSEMRLKAPKFTPDEIEKYNIPIVKP